MGKKTDLAKQIEALQAEHDAAPDDDDDDLEIDVEKDGNKVRLRGRHARRVMRKLGLDDDDTPPAGDGKDGDQGDGDDGDGAKDKEPPAAHRYFRK